MDISGNRSEIPEKLRNAVLEKDGEYHLDRSCEIWRSVIQSERGKEYSADNKKKEG